METKRELVMTDRTERMENKERTGDDGQDRENGEWKNKERTGDDGQDRENGEQRENW